MHWRQRRMRRPDLHEPGAAHALTFSCYRRFAFLRAERTCTWLADAINEARQEHHFVLWAYVFMPDHVHLLIWPTRPDFSVSPVLKAIKQPVGTTAVAYLRKYDPEWLERITVRQGRTIQRRFWQPGGGFDAVEKEPTIILTMIEYIHNNPVRGALVVRHEDWKWSSAGWRLGKNGLVPDAIDFGGRTVCPHDRE
jgi:putative transposase